MFVLVAVFARRSGVRGREGCFAGEIRTRNPRDDDTTHGCGEGGYAHRPIVATIYCRVTESRNAMVENGLCRNLTYSCIKMYVKKPSISFKYTTNRK